MLVLVMLAALPVMLTGRTRGEVDPLPEYQFLDEVSSEEVEVEEEAAGIRGPVLLRGQTAVTAARGDNVTLYCEVMRLGDTTVSWVRSRDLQILSHGGAVFSSDSRLRASVSRAGDVTTHALLVAGLRGSDGGRYECQLNTEPKRSQLFTLTVTESAAVQHAAATLQVRAALGVLRCEVRALRGQPPPRPAWYYGGELVEPQSARWAGAALAWRARGAAGRLVLRGARRPGRYRCRADGAAHADLLLTAADLAAAADETSTDAMQRDEAVAAAAGGRGAGGAARAPAASVSLATAAALLVSVVS